MRDFNQYGQYTSLIDYVIKERQLFLDGEVNEDSASSIIHSTLLMDACSSGCNDKITLNIMSPGGSVAYGLAIRDCLRTRNCVIETVGYGMCASMGAFLLACAGTPGHRYATENCQILIHQLMTGMSGQESDLQIAARHAADLRASTDKIMAAACGRTEEEIHDATERDRWLTAQEALEFGLIDHIIKVD